ncbi:aldo/keto reductase [Streptomyces mirabilis]|uniref:aldo/keto reductase n=1 Tax=Streptomyces mirabilis TaxID=68239 RepID=UPI0036760594
MPTDRNDPNSGGSHRKSLRRSAEESLRRLATDHVDPLCVHAWDECTAAEETLRALDDLIRSGKVLAVGVRNTPAWVIARSQAIAELRGWSAYCGPQIEYSLAAGPPDRELLPMARALGLTVTAWSPLARGLLAGKRPPSRLPASRRQALDAVTEIAAETGLTPARVARAWVLRQGLLPVPGTRTVAQLRDNLGALAVRLDGKQLERLDAATRVRREYPYDFLYDRRTALAPPEPERGITMAEHRWRLWNAQFEQGVPRV